jgi:hypothetical protein
MRGDYGEIITNTTENEQSMVLRFVLLVVYC